MLLTVLSYSSTIFKICAIESSVRARAKFGARAKFSMYCILDLKTNALKYRSRSYTKLIFEDLMRQIVFLNIFTETNSDPRVTHLVP